MFSCNQWCICRRNYKLQSHNSSLWINEAVRGRTISPPSTVSLTSALYSAHFCDSYLTGEKVEARPGAVTGLYEIRSQALALHHYSPPVLSTLLCPTGSPGEMLEDTGSDSNPNQVHLSLQELEVRHLWWLNIF